MGGRHDNAAHVLGDESHRHPLRKHGADSGGRVREDANDGARREGRGRRGRRGSGRQFRGRGARGAGRLGSPKPAPQPTTPEPAPEPDHEPATPEATAASPPPPSPPPRTPPAPTRRLGEGGVRGAGMTQASEAASGEPMMAIGIGVIERGGRG